VRGVAFTWEMDDPSEHDEPPGELGFLRVDHTNDATVRINDILREVAYDLGFRSREEYLATLVLEGPKFLERFD
jgi:hypothetical protein